MSSISNEKYTGYLALDLGIYPYSKVIRETLEKESQNQILELKPDQMTDTDWDQVLGQIIKYKKCITL